MNLKLVWSIAISISLSRASMPKSTDRDDTFTKVCNHYGGVYTGVSQDLLTGPKCTVEFKMFTKSEVEARELCQLYIPWKLVKATEGAKTTCEVEASLRCEDGWLYMFGYCYKLYEKKMFTRDAAAAQCKAGRNSSIARIPHKYAVGVWKRFFPTISQVWMDPSEAFDRVIVPITENSQAIALAFTGKHYHFHVQHNSLVRINPDWRLQALCEYEPPMTISEVRYLGERYSEIYYPTMNVENGLLFRSASMYSRPNEQIKGHHEICKGIMKALRVTDVVEFHPSQADLEQMGNYKEVSYARTAGVALLDMFKMDTVLCDRSREEYEVPASRKQYFNYRLVFSGNEPSHVCDNLRSAAMVFHRKNHQAILRSMSDAQPGPLLCKFGFTQEYTFNEPPGSTVFIRKGDKAVAHTFVDQGMSYDDAEKHCQSQGGHISGFESYDELMNMIKSMPAKISTKTVYMGAKRNPKCRNVGGFHPDDTHECGRKRVMQWQHGVATNQIETTWWLNDNAKLLNPTGADQACMTMYREQQASWAAPGQKGRLDDDHCHNKFAFFCQKEVSLIKVN